MRIRSTGYFTQQLAENASKMGGIHPYHEILFFCSGDASLKWMAQTFPVSAPCLFLLPPNTPHCLTQTSPQLTCWYIELEAFEEDPFPEMEQIFIWNRLQDHLDFNDSALEQLTGTLQLLEDIIRSDMAEHQIHAAEIALLEVQRALLLVHRFLMTRGDAVLPTRKDDLADQKYRTKQGIVSNLMRYMESNYFERITLTMLAEAAHVNQSYLIRLFKEFIGMTPMQYLHELRMNAAQCFLRFDDQMTVQAVAEATGFQSIYYFSRSFKQKFGVSPQPWRMKK